MNKKGDLLHKHIYGILSKARGPTFLAPLLIVLGLASFPFFNLPAYLLVFLIAVFMYCGLCVSWNIIGGYARYRSFGHAAFFGLGAYVSALLYKAHGLPLYYTAILAGLFTMVFAMAIGFPALKIRGPYFIVLTFIMVPATRTVFLNLGEFTGGAGGIFLRSPFDIGTYYLIMLGLAVSATIMAVVIERTKFGVGLTSIREDEVAAEVMGVNTTKMKMIAFGLSAFFPGIIGAVIAFYSRYMNPVTVFTEPMTIAIVLFSIFGGTKRWIGPIIGAFILASLARLLHIYAGGIIDLIRLDAIFPYIHSGILTGFIYGLVLVLVIIFMPGGILAWLEKRFVKESHVARM